MPLSSATSFFFGSGVGHATCMMRRACLLAVHGFRENARYAEDIDLSTRLLGQARFASLPETLYIYRRHAQSTTMRFGQLHQQAGRDFRRRALESIWPEVPEDLLVRYSKMRRSRKRSWVEWHRLRSDLRKLANAMLAANWLLETDKPLLLEEISRHVQVESPYLYRKIRQWLRYRIRRHLSWR